MEESFPMNIKPLLSVVACGALLSAAASTNYYLNPEKLSGVIGESRADGELHARALHVEFSGGMQEVNGRKFPTLYAKGGKSLLIWKFNRAPGDRKVYRVDLKARLYVEPDARSAGTALPELAVGFLDYRGERYTDRYFVSDDSAMGVVATAEANSAERPTLQNDKLLLIPASQQEFYVILSAVTPNLNGKPYGRVESFRVDFTPWELPAGDEAECPYWSADPGMVHNVLEFGADPTGQKDSAPAIQKALDIGGEVVIPAGIYLLESTLVIRKSNTTLRGENGAVLTRKRREGNDPTKNDYTYIRNSRFPGTRLLSNIRISGLRLLTPDWDSPQLNNWTNGIALSGVRDSVVENCEVRLPAHDGISLSCTENTAVRNCMTFGARHGITIGGNFRGRGSFHSQIVNCRVSRAWDTGIVVGILSYDVLVTGNLIKEIGSHAIDIFNCRKVTVTGNQIHNWVMPGMNPYPGTFRQAVGIFIHTDWGVTRTIPTENITVSGNTVVCDYEFTLPLEQQRGEKKEAAIYYSPICLQITGDLVRNVTVTGNTLTGGAKGIHITALPQKEMQSAKPQDGTPQNLTVVGNTVTGQKFTALECSGNGIPMRGIIADNVFSDYPAGGWSTGDTGLVTQNNLK